MKTKRILIAYGLALGLSGYVQAAPCDSSTTCELPASNGSQASWSPSASGMSSIQSLNSVGPTGNVSGGGGAKYFFAASTSDQGATVAKGALSTTGDGSEVLGSFSFPSGSTPSSPVVGGVVQNLLGNQSYTFYAQACPSASALDSALCSSWARVGTRNTSIYPPSVFSAPVAPTDATTTMLNVRTSVPAADQGNISLIRIDIHDLITPANNQTLAPMGFINGTSIYPIDTEYTQNGGFKPNVKYEYLGRVVYPYGVDVPAAGQTRGPIWTTPVQPGSVVVSNITHCSAQLTATNSSGNPANPSYTTYRMCATGTNGSCANDGISGATSGSTAEVTITGLTAGANYTPNAQALVGNGDGSSSGWNSSTVLNGSVFATLTWGGTFTVGSVTSTGATFSVSGITGAGSISTWSIRHGGAGGTVLASGSGDPSGSHPVTVLTPNTVYSNLVIVLTETSGCASTLAFNPTSFTTTPIAPSSGSYSNVFATSLQVNWVDGSANPNGSTYEVELCTDNLFTANCQTNLVNKPTFSTTFSVNATTQYFAHVRTRNQSRPTWPDSPYLDLGSVTTSLNQRSISISPSAATVVSGVPTVFTATVLDETGGVVSGQAVNWSYSSGNSQISPLNGVSTTLSATAVGGHTLTASLSGYPNGTASVTVNAAGPLFVTAPSIVLAPDHLTGTLSTLGNDNVSGEGSLTYNWTLESGPSAISVSPNNTNAAKNATVTFSKAGVYVLRVTITNSNGSNFQLTPATTVNQQLVAIGVCPAGQGSCPTSITLRKLQDQQFVANGRDQFGDAMTLASVTWGVVGAGSVNSAGVFNSNQIGTNVTVTAQSGSISGSILLSLVSFDVSNAKAYPVPYKASSGITHITFANLGSQVSIHVYTTAGRRVFEAQVTSDTYDWDIKNSAGESIASGVYFYVIESPEGKKNGKLIIIK